MLDNFSKPHEPRRLSSGPYWPLARVMFSLAALTMC